MEKKSPDVMTKNATMTFLVYGSIFDGYCSMHSKYAKVPLDLSESTVKPGEISCMIVSFDEV